MHPPRPRGALVALALVLSGLAAVSPAVAAHASLVSSTPADGEVLPAAPRQVVLDFDESVAPAGDGIVVLSAKGTEVQRSAPRISSAGRTLTQPMVGGGQGSYTVSYRVVSADGHPVAGSFVFAVGRSSPTAALDTSTDPLTSLLGVLGRALAYGGALLAVGALVVARDVDRRRWPDGRLWMAAATTALAGAVLNVVAVSAELAGTGPLGGLPSLRSVVETFGWGSGPMARMVWAAMFVVAVMVAQRFEAAAVAAAVVSVVVLLLPALSGHAAATSAVAQLLDAAHLLGAAVWVGGLTALVLTWSDEPERLRRFSRLAAVAAGVVILTGAVAAAWQLGAPGELFASTYGRVLSLKVVLVGCVLLAGWWNRRRIVAAGRVLARAPAGFRIEVLLAVAVVAVTAVLVDTRPPEEVRPEAVQAVGRAGETTVRLRVEPASAGANTLHLWFLAGDGSVAEVQAVEVRVSTSRVAGRRVPVTMISPSHAVAEGVELTAGRWSVAVTVVSDGRSSTTTLEVPIG